MTARIVWTPRKAAFRYPMDPARRTAILVDWFCHGRFSAKAPFRAFPGAWCEGAARFAPEAIAATGEQLLALCSAPSPPAVSHALIVLERPGDPMLTAAVREQLWRGFHVPVFEQMIGPRGELLAFECEAHDGLHIETPGLRCDAYRVETAPCACGRTTPRLNGIFSKGTLGAAANARFRF